MTTPRRPVLLLLAVAAFLPPGAAAQAARQVGIADQKPAAYADARLRALGVHLARLIVPYDAATSEPATVQAWLDAAAAAGMTPHVAFEHLSTDACPSFPCTPPSAATYGAAVRRFIARFPQVRTYTTWNEANHVSQPTSSRPEMVAAYYDELRAACPGCTVVAGDVIDSGTYRSWLEQFLRASTTTPQLWGLHDYGDVTYGRTTGVDTVLNTVPGSLWIEETGGIVAIRDSNGRTRFSASEADAATAVSRAFDIAATRPRVTRMYVYQWQAFPSDTFDAGLVRPDGTLRPSYDAMVTGLRQLGTQAGTATATIPAAGVQARWSVSWSARDGRPVLLRVRCPAALGTCRGTVTATLRLTRGTSSHARHAFGERSYRTTATHRSVALRLTATAKLRRQVARARVRTLVLRIVPASGPVQRVTLTVPKP